MLHDIGPYQRFWQAVALLIVAGAGVMSTIASSSGGSGGTPPLATITFPSSGHETDDISITVTGTASDETGVAAVAVNGFSADSNDGFATWEVNVPLIEGQNTLTVSTLDTLGFDDPAAAQVVVTVTSAPPLATVNFPPLNSFSDASSITVTGTANDDKSGVASVQVNGVDTTSSDDFATWRAIVPLNPGSNTLTVSTTDTSGNADPVAAEVVVNVANDVSGNAVTFGDGYGIALVGDNAYVADFDLDQLVLVNINTGDSQVISDNATGGGPVLSGPSGIALISGGTTALVTNFLPDELLSVNLAGGNRSRLSSANQNVGSGPTLFGPSGIGIVDATLAVVSNFAADDVLTVDLVSGDREVLSGDDGVHGVGPAFAQPDGIAVDLANDRIIVTDALIEAVLAVDLMTGDREILSDNATVGGGAAFVGPAGIALDDSATSVLVADRDANRVLLVDLATGSRMIFSDANTDDGTGPSFSIPTGIALDSANGRAVVSGENLIVVELGSGDRVIVGQ